MWEKIKKRRELILKGSLAAAILLVLALDVWLGTCGFERCPTAREIQAYNPDEGGRVYDRNGRLMGRPPGALPRVEMKAQRWKVA